MIVPDFEFVQVIEDGLALEVSDDHGVYTHRFRLLYKIVEVVKLIQLVDTVEHGLSLVVLDIE